MFHEKFIAILVGMCKNKNQKVTDWNNWLFYWNEWSYIGHGID